MRHSRLVGFSLIELMVVVAILGIIASIAVPSYNNYLIKANRKAAQAVLLDIANRERQYFLDARRFFYTADFAAVGFSIPDDVSRYYTVTVEPEGVAPPPPTFTATATPKPGLLQDGDGILVVDHRGNKTRGGSADNW